MPSQALRKCPDQFMASTLDDEMILIDAASGAFFALKETGLEIWSLIDGETDLDAIIDAMSKEYFVEPDQCRLDVEQFVEQLLCARFIEHV